MTGFGVCRGGGCGPFDFATSGTVAVVDGGAVRGGAVIGFVGEAIVGLVCAAVGEAVVGLVSATVGV